MKQQTTSISDQSIFLSSSSVFHSNPWKLLVKSFVTWRILFHASSLKAVTWCDWLGWYTRWTKLWRSLFFRVPPANQSSSTSWGTFGSSARQLRCNHAQAAGCVIEFTTAGAAPTFRAAGGASGWACTTAGASGWAFATAGAAAGRASGCAFFTLGVAEECSGNFACSTSWFNPISSSSSRWRRCKNPSSPSSSNLVLNDLLFFSKNNNLNI